jgi:hypothetical protein
LALTIATALVAATALALGGRGGGDDAADAGSTAGPPRATATFNARDAVMALSDLPSGWAVDPDDDDEEDENDFFCGEDLDAVVEPEEVNEAQAQFAQGGSIPLLLNGVGAYAPGDADVAFDKFEEIVAPTAPPSRTRGRPSRSPRFRSQSRATNPSRSSSPPRSRGWRSASTSSSSGSPTA